MSAKNNQSISILGVRIDNCSLPQIIKILKDFVRSGKPHQIATINAEFIVEAQKNIIFANALDNADLNIADGTGPYLFSQFFGEKLKTKISGVKLSKFLMLLAAKYQYRVFLLGASEGIAQRAAKSLKRKIPKLNIVGATCGGKALDKRDDIAMIDAVIDTQPDILLVAFGHPKQDIWIARYKHLLGVPIMIGIGGTLDYFAGVKQEVPRWMSNFGLEWLWRLYREPWRWKRIYTAIVVFPWLCLQYLIKQKISPKRRD